MDSALVEVLRLEVVREEIDYAHADVAEALELLYPSGGRGGPRRLPLAPAHLTLELRGVPTAVANAIRRVLAQELAGHCLTFDRAGFDREATTDPFMADDDFIRGRLRMLPLIPQIPANVVRDLRYALYATNATEEVMTLYAGDLVLEAGDLEAPLFNPTHELAFLQPGGTLSLRDIRLSEGYATQDAAYAVAVRAALRPLDLAEVPRAATHAGGGAAENESGYEESSLTANPRVHRVSCYIPAAPPGRQAAVGVAVSACTAVMERLRNVQGILEAAMQRAALPTGGLSLKGRDGYLLVTPGAEKVTGVLVVKNETDTIGNLLTRTVCELIPEVGYAGYTCVPHEKQMQLRVIHAVGSPHELVRGVLLRAVKHAYAVFDKIRRGIRG